jgi:hypothetical protein
LPSRTRSAPLTHVFSSTRSLSSRTWMRWPVGDRPGAGSKVRGTTGPSSSVRDPSSSPRAGRYSGLRPRFFGTRVFGCLDQRIQTPLRGYLFVTSHHRPVPLFTNRPGGGWRTSAMSLLSSSTVKRRGRPGLGRSPSPKVPSASKRCSRRRTVCALHCNSLVMASTPSPSQLRTTIRVCRIKSAGYAGSLPVCAPSVLPSHPGRSHSQDLQHFRALPFSVVSLLILSPFEELSSR